MKTLNINELEKIGNIWESNGMKRLYINSDTRLELMDIKVEYHNSGSIQSITINGERISNNAGHKLIRDYAEGKFFYDYNKKAFNHKNMYNNEFENLVKEIEKKY